MTNRKYEKLIADYDKHCIRISKATTININEKPAEKIKRIKWLEEKYDRWFEYYFPNYAKVKCSWFQKKVANLLITLKKIYLLFEVFRSGGKTVHINMGVPLYLYYVKKELWYMVLLGQTDPKAKRLLSGIQAQLKFNQRLLNDYGNRFKLGDYADGDFSTTDGARFRSFGFGQSPRGEQEEGRRPDYISVDDVDTKKHINNDEIMQDAEDFIFEDLMGCFDAADDSVERFVFANNNFHKKSLTNRIKERFKQAIAKAKQKGKTPKHYTVHVPAVKDMVNFEPNWPEKTSSDYWRQKYEDVTHRSFCREYMHIHVAAGAIFKPEYMQWKKMLPYGKYDGLAFYGDLSYKVEGDFKGMVLVGKTGRELHIIHTYLRKSSRADVAKWLYDLYEDKNLSRYNIKYMIEGLFAQDEFVNDFDTEGDLRGYHIPVVADKRGKANKFDRIESTEGNFQRRWVFFNIDEKEHVDQVELLDQYYAFQRGSGAHDDGPDCVHGAFDQVNRISFVEKFEPRFSKRESKSSNRY